MAIGIGSELDPRLYDIATETASGVFWTTLFLDELAASSITSEVLNVGTSGGVVDAGIVTGGTLEISFTTEPSGAELAVLDALVLTHDATDKPTRGWKKWEENPVQTTSLSSWQSAISKSPPRLKGGIYRISWTFEWRLVASGALNSTCDGRFVVDGGPKSRHSHITEAWEVESGWDFQRFDEGEKPTLAIEYQVASGNDSVEVRRCKMSIERME